MTLWEAFAVTGVAHLMAISGLHVTGCALFALWLLRLGLRLPPLRAIRERVVTEMAVVLAVTGGYVLLAGASLPALRTLAMVAIVALQRMLRRALPLHVTLALAAALLCAADPLALTSAGFWLSFAATAALLAILDADRGWLARAGTFVRAQLAVTALLTPVLAAVFGRVSLVSPLVNAFAIPAFSFIVLPLVLFATALEIAAIDASAPVWRGLAALLDAAWPPLSAIAAVAGRGLGAGRAAAAAAGRRGRRHARGAPAAALRACAPRRLRCCSRSPAAPPRGRQPGRGRSRSSTSARAWRPWSKPGTTCWSSTPDRAGAAAAAPRASRCVPFLRARGIRRIDRLVVSHQDMDHAGGVVPLRRSFEVTSTMGEFPDEGAAGRTACRRGERWRWDGVEFRVLHPPANFAGDDNDRSCALMVSGIGGRALLLADPESAGEESLVSERLRAEVVLLPHHGSRTSSGPGLVQAVSARLGIASAGFGNRWGMPAAEVVARWRAAGTTVLSTAATGAVTVQICRARARPSRSRPSAAVRRTGGARRRRTDGPGQRPGPHGIMPRHVGNHHRGRPDHVADPPVLGAGGRDRARAPVDPAAQARDPARADRPGLEAGRDAHPERPAHRGAVAQFAARAGARRRTGQPPPGPRDHEGSHRRHRPPRRARARAFPERARHHCRDLAVARTARDRDRHDPGVRLDHVARGSAIRRSCPAASASH